MKILKVSEARRLVRSCMTELRLALDHIDYFEHALIETSLKGIDTHGIRLLPLYIREINEGRSKMNPNIRFYDQGYPNLLQMDADSAAGIVAGFHATHKCIELAKAYGIGLVSVKNSNHFGAASVYGDIMAKQDLLGFVMTNAAPRVVPFNGAIQLFGTNPICFTAPSTEDHDLFSLDMATSQISYSKVKEHKLLNKDIDASWGVDQNGEPVIAPEKLFALSPVGGYKGQGLSMMVQVLTSLLTAGPFDFELTHLDEEPYNSGRDISHFFMAINIAAFTNVEHFKSRVNKWTSHINNSQAKPGHKVMCPGDPESVERKVREEHGIKLNDVDYKALIELIDKHNVIVN